MTVESAPNITGAGSVPEARLEPNAIGVAQDTVIGMATSAPAASVGLTLAALAAATAYAGLPVIILTALPMIIIANCYRRLNLWNANCGASFEWVGRTISPYLGFLTGWLMIMGGIIGTVSTTVVLGPSVLAVFGSASTAIAPNLVIDTVVVVVMLVIAIVGIRITARTQVGMGIVEYAILIGFAIVGLIAVISHRHGTFPISSGWFSVSGINGKGSLAAGFLIAMFSYTGWDGTIYVNEEVKHRRTNPGKAAMMAVAFLAVIYTLSQVGLQGVVSPAKLQANSTSALVYIAQSLGGGGWAKVMAFGLALSVIATTGTGIVLGARVIYGMANHRVLPPFLGNVSPAILHPRRGQPDGWPDPPRPHLGLPAGHLAGHRFRRRDRLDRLALRGLLRPHRTRRHHLLPAPHLQQRPGRRDSRRAPARRRRIPRLDPGEVAHERPAAADLVVGRSRGGRCRPHAGCALRATVPVLPSRAGERRPGTLARSARAGLGALYPTGRCALRTMTEIGQEYPRD